MKCVSCGGNIPKGQEKTTHRNGQDLPLCRLCWRAALDVQKLLQPDNRAEAARDRYLRAEALRKGAHS